MVSIRRKVLEKGNIVQEQLIRVLQKHEDAIEEGSGSSPAVDITQLANRVNNLQDIIGTENKAGSVLARLKALEEKE